ncbi:MAG: SWIM zinc finger family protein [Planctomycetes bacterium]|nr:SWIM zinc finger family protein [Planctomycetota bacterium]
MWYSRDWYRPSRPRRARGGIKAQSKRGGFGASWWAKRWIAVLESFNIGARLSRGKSYARGGQVLSIAVDKGSVQAKVQGSRPKPYDIQIDIKPLAAADWKKLARAFSGQALFAAKLLAGEMPQDIEKAFLEADLSLFPERLDDLTTACSCPDWSNPCKHIAAVYYLLGEEFDRDPFLLFKLRGLSREELVGLLGQSSSPGDKHQEKATTSEPDEVAPPPEPIRPDLATFWKEGAVPEDFFGEVQVPPVSAALLQRLGHFPFWRGETRFLEALEPVYAQASRAGLEVFLGNHVSESPPKAS